MTEQAPAGRAAQFAALYLEDRIRDQLGVYHQRRVEAEKAHDQAIHAKWTLSTLAAIAGSVGAAVASWRVELAIAAAFLAAAATALTAYQSLYAFPRLAKLYRDAEMSLSTLTAAGKTLGSGLTEEQTRQAVRRIEKVFAQENGQWGQLVEHVASESGDGARDGEERS
jgi:hypothetical protein